MKGMPPRACIQSNKVCKICSLITEAEISTQSKICLFLSYHGLQQMHRGIARHTLAPLWCLNWPFWFNNLPFKGSARPCWLLSSGLAASKHKGHEYLFLRQQISLLFCISCLSCVLLFCFLNLNCSINKRKENFISSYGW